MGALSHYIERAGVATTSISLVRPQTEKVRPPRALWVPYALGRPLGSAGDADFQTDVMRAAFGLLATATEPTIADYPVEAPAEASPEVWACPLNLATPASDALVDRLLGEIAGLRPWAMETRRTRGRTHFGVSGASADQVDEVATTVAAIAESGEVLRTPEGSGVEWRQPMPLLIRYLADDLRSFYHEGLASQPGPGAPNHDALNAWIFGGTALGEAFLAIADHLTDVDDGMAKVVRGLLIPEGHYRGGSAFPATTSFGHSADEDDVSELQAELEA